MSIEAFTDTDIAKEVVAITYDDGRITFETGNQLSGVETPQRLRFLDGDIEAESLQLAVPSAVAVDNADVMTVATTSDDAH